MALYGHKTISFQAVITSGSWGISGVVRLQFSNDGSNWVDHTGDDITLQTLKTNIPVDALFARAFVQNAESSTLVVTITMVAK